MKSKRDVYTRIIISITLLLHCTSFSFAQSDGITEVMTDCCKCVTDCFDNALSITEESLAVEELHPGEYPERYDASDPVSMGEVDPWEAYDAQQEEDMKKAMGEEVRKAWEEFNKPEPPDISDQIIKP